MILSRVLQSSSSRLGMMVRMASSPGRICPVRCTASTQRPHAAPMPSSRPVPSFFRSYSLSVLTAVRPIWMQQPPTTISLLPSCDDTTQQQQQQRQQQPIMTTIVIPKRRQSSSSSTSSSDDDHDSSRMSNPPPPLLPDKVHLSFVQPDTTVKLVEARVGDSFLQVAHRNDIDLEGACEG